jgi:hypothetical protein
MLRRLRDLQVHFTYTKMKVENQKIKTRCSFAAGTGYHCTEQQKHYSVSLASSWKVAVKG